MRPGASDGYYPTLRHILLLCFFAFPLAQFAVFPLLAEVSVRLGLLAAELFLLWVALLAIRRRRWVVEDLLLLNAVRPAALYWTPVAATGAALLAVAADLQLGRIFESGGWGPPLAFQRYLLEIQLAPDLSGLGLVILTVVLLPAVCEEAFFRGFVYTGLRYHYGPLTALIGSALIFAAAHFNPWQFPALFALGLFLAGLVHWTHSLYPAIVAHAVNNALNVLAVNVRSQTGHDYLGAFEPLPMIAVAAAAVALAGGMWKIRIQRPIMPVISPHSRPAPADGIPESWRPQN